MRRKEGTREEGAHEGGERPRGALLLSFFGVGRFPRAPGTAGSFVTAVLIVLAEGWMGAGLLGTTLLLAFGVLVTLRFGNVRDVRGHADPQWIVADEVAGQSLALLGAFPSKHLVAAILAFLIFRLLDTTKPGPIRRLETLPGGLGVLCDDLAAGLVAGAVTFGVGFAWLGHP